MGNGRDVTSFVKEGLNQNKKAMENDSKKYKAKEFISYVFLF
jgi:hypothetical protein